MSGSASETPRFLLDPDMSEVETGTLVGGEVACFSAPSPGREPPNQDAAALLPYGPDAGVLLVADGMGGGPSGERAAGLAVQAVWTSLVEGLREGWKLRTAILNGIERANERVCELGIGAATTLAAAEIQQGRVRPYHVGDSLILLVGQRGKLKLETVSHSPVAFAVEAGVLDAGDAMHHEDRHLVSNLIGSGDMRIEVGSERVLAARDTLVVASDGLTDNLTSREIADCVRTGPLREAAERLAGTARRRMYAPGDHEPSKPDDLTLLVFRPRRKC
ncbi:MAG: PP2C family protein-serine/threonine phosphatase [Myxococcota bacterium]